MQRYTGKEWKEYEANIGNDGQWLLKRLVAVRLFFHRFIQEFYRPVQERSLKLWRIKRLEHLDGPAFHFIGEVLAMIQSQRKPIIIKTRVFLRGEFKKRFKPIGGVKREINFKALVFPFNKKLSEC